MLWIGTKLFVNEQKQHSYSGEKKTKLWGQTDRDKCSKDLNYLAGLASLGQLAADTGSVLAAAKVRVGVFGGRTART